MTGGLVSGANGARALWFSPIAWIAGVAAVVAFVNATSRLIEAHRDAEALPSWAPFVWEYSSALLLVALAPAVQEAVRRLPIRAQDLGPTLLGHAGLTIPFSLLHVGGMVALRKLVYALAGGFYDFSHGNLALELIYEWRKDVVTYASFAALFWFLQWRAEQAAARIPASPERIEIRDGATAVYLQPGEIAWVEAAGNYVEFHTGAGVRLVRGTLSAWAAKLAPMGFVRAHRSRIVNRARIRAIRPKPSGDVEIEFDDGREIAGSRRYRDAVDAPHSIPRTGRS